MRAVDDALSEAIRRARLREGLTQAELAGEVGTSQAQISNWERGRSQPSAEQLHALKEVLGRIVRRSDGRESPVSAMTSTSTKALASAMPKSSPSTSPAYKSAVALAVPPPTPANRATAKPLTQQELESRLWAAADSL